MHSCLARAGLVLARLNYCSADASLMESNPGRAPGGILNTGPPASGAARQGSEVGGGLCY